MRMILRRLIAVMILLGACTGVSFAEVKKASLLSSFYNFFPNVSEMEGGASRWLTTDISESTFSDYAELKRTYSSFNKNPEKIWQIQRKKSFKVTLSVVFAKNFIVAESLYKKKSERKVRFRKKVRFGDGGFMLIEPVKGKYPDAHYELLFIDKTFVVSLKSTDGFALMDFADYVETGISGYILSNFDRFFIKKLNITASSNGHAVQTEELSFVEEDLKELVIEGKVRDADNQIVPFAEVELKDFKLNTTTDEAGYYRFILPFGGKNQVALIKNFTMKLVQQNTSAEQTRIYDMRVTYQMNSLKQDRLYLKVTGRGDHLFGLLKGTDENLKKATRFQIEGDQIHFIRNCGKPGAAFRCIQIFDGTVTPTGVSGTWKGTGGGGKWEGKRLTNSVEKMIELVGSDCTLSQVELDVDGNMLNESNQLSITYGDNTTKQFIRGQCDFSKMNTFFSDRTVLMLTHLMSNRETDADLFVFDVDRKDNNYRFKQSRKVGTLVAADEPYTVKIDMTDTAQSKGVTEFLIGMPMGVSTVGKHEFAGLMNYALIRPKLKSYRLVNSRKKSTSYLTEIISLQGKQDYASNSAKVRPDGKSDIQLRIHNFEKRGVISFIEVKNTGSLNFKWNTNIFDLFPGMAVKKGEQFYRNVTGQFRLSIEKGDTIDIFLFRPEELDQNNSKLSYRIKLGSEWISGNFN